MSIEEVRLSKVAKEAIDALSKFFKDKEHRSEDIAVAKIATGIISSWTRQQYTKNAERATGLMIARELANNKDELVAYIRGTMPEMGALKALPERIGQAANVEQLASENTELKAKNTELQADVAKYTARVAELQELMARKD